MQIYAKVKYLIFKKSLLPHQGIDLWLDSANYFSGKRLSLDYNLLFFPHSYICIETLLFGRIYLRKNFPFLEIVKEINRIVIFYLVTGVIFCNSVYVPLQSRFSWHNYILEIVISNAMTMPIDQKLTIPFNIHIGDPLITNPSLIEDLK